MNKYQLTFLLFSTLIVAAVSGCTTYGPDYGAEEIEYFSGEYEADNNTTLTVNNINGQIEINRWDGDKVELEAIKRTNYGEDELQKVNIIVNEIDDELKVETKYPALENVRVSVDINIKVPENVTVDIIETTNGNIVISDTKGNTTAITTNGNIAISNVKGYITAISSNGALDIQRTTGIGDLQTTNGRIEAHILDIRDDVDIRCTNGAIILFIDPSLDADIEMETTNGHISISEVELVATNLESTHVEGVIGEGGNKMHIRTTNGNVNLNKLVV
ncbi:DUF4097 family beta strand repeat-containing protein [Methanococcoides sp. AM1]|uniref:DUF4097 family beta strand repeat-containing protein n=1 Tax=Methanococcoides sp. AM1 TaxID=1201011 RepID=UPI0014385B42|nr:DUF4097 family beta strand repeat-containing protein [Methanococcoides sp. AM1]